MREKESQTEYRGEGKRETTETMSQAMLEDMLLSIVVKNLQSHVLRKMAKIMALY